MIESFLEAVEENVIAALTLGDEHEAVKLIQTPGKRRWKEKLDDAAVAKKLQELGVKKPWKEREVIGITAAERQLDKKKKSIMQRFNNLTELHGSAMKVVPAEDAREAVVSTTKLEELE
jgi:hypothetical protein